MDGESSPSESTAETEEIVTFSDLVRAHCAWEHELHEQEDHNRPPDEAIEHGFRRKWRLFEQRYGSIDDAYWSVRDASAVALSIKRQASRLRPTPERIPHFHRATDWATRDEPDVAAALDDCEILAVRAEEILRGPSQLIALRRVTAVASHLLGFVDREWGRWPPLPTPQPMVEAAHGTRSKDFVDRQRKELERVERFYNRVGNGQARILFFWGMAQGLVVLGVLTALAGVLAWLAGKLDGGQAHWSEIRLFALCVLAGALGAILSVLSRMASITGKFKLDHELGRKNVRWIGIYRSFVGGIFGFATFLILASGIGITQTPERGSKFAYYGILALFSGFFERFTKLSSTGSDEPASTEPSPAHATETPGHSER